jgi:hypothetical protein
MSERDLVYETNNIGFDWQYPDGGIKCKNYNLCEAVLPEWWFNCKGKYLCTTCDLFGWNELEFRNINNDCNVCYNHGIEMKFPTDCGHWFCVNCCKKILFWDETRYHLSPEPYGCQPCPNGCINPIKGKQCYCEEYDEIQKNWENTHPEEFKKYNDDEHYSIEHSQEEQGSVFSSKKCPICRKKYKH